MKILLSTEVLLKLESWCTTAGNKEVSGLGTVRYEQGNIVVEAVWLLDAGTEGLTDIPPERIAALNAQGVDITKLKLWWHRHPVGNGLPGPHNWSGIDEGTIVNTPLGSSPELVKWSVSIVRTPYGWVGRVDHYTKERTVHCEVQQPFTATEHEVIRKMLMAQQSASYRFTPQIKDRRPTKGEKQQIVEDAVQVFKGKVRRGPGRNFMLRRLSEFGLTYEKMREIKMLLQERELPEEVAELYDVDLWTLRELKLITWKEMEDAMIRQHNTALEYHKGQGTLWDDNHTNTD